MTTKAERYLRRAEEFEAMARKAQADTTKIAYEHLARSYRQLGMHVSTGFNIGADLRCVPQARRSPGEK
jgi:hypothetical protein